MSKELLVKGPMQASNQIFVKQQVPIYSIYLETCFNRLKKVSEELGTIDSKLMIITDSNVAGYHLQPLQDALAESSMAIYSHTIPAGEENKNLDTVYRIYDDLIQNGFERNDWLIALGGGVVGDITGYVAATYLRGIRFIQVPTTLLAMVDSSIGGKTGVDYASYKNMVGAFYQPQAVYMNLSVLNTLPNREYYSGYGEIVKHAWIRDMEYAKMLNEKKEKLATRDLEALEEVVYRSCQIKREVVEIDPTEKGDRALLNFGHTIGHAIERYMNFQLLHGECVAIGMVGALHISYKRGYLSKEELEEGKKLLKDFQLPSMLTSYPIAKYNKEEVLSILKHDKKMVSGSIRFILVRQLGAAYIERDVTDEEILSALSYLREEKLNETCN
ncbi:MAG: 3-dehydroquinate synthase [Clostridiales bacterium]|nr:3-dehydroquinate synthase [Clostridiales bacterium]